jgi:hypothetical protein
MVAALVVLSLIGLTSAATEIGLHGLSFFVFRNAGAGAGNARNLNENQGPGQPDAPGAHHHARGHQPGSPARGASAAHHHAHENKPGSPARKPK